MNTVVSIPRSPQNERGDIVAFPGKDMELPKPLVAAGTDLRDFQYMPLDVVRFRDSDFTALIDAEAFRAGVMLWCAAWHQVPAASLPDDDRVLANLAGYGRVVAAWLAVKESALHGWIKCSDGRLYHPVVAEKANESYEAKLKHRYKLFTDRVRKKNLKLPPEHQVPTPDIKVWISSGCPSDWEEIEAENPSTGIPLEFQRNSNGKNQNSNGIDNNSKHTPDFSTGIPLEKALKGEGEGEGELRDIITTTSSSDHILTNLAFVRYNLDNRKFYSFDELLRENPNLQSDFFTQAEHIVEMTNMTGDVLSSAWNKISTWGAQAEKKTQHKWMVIWITKFVRDEYDNKITATKKQKNDFTFGDLAMGAMTNANGGGYFNE